jgi:dolichol-phosphate mannosyltransferase
VPPEPTLSIVVPAFNEGSIVERAVDALRREIADRLDAVEIVVVDDASTDATGAVLDRLAAADPRLVVDHAEVNRGHGPSVRRGLDLARGEWILQLDADGEIAPADFWALWAERSRAPMIAGYRVDRRSPGHRIALNRLARWTVRGLASGRPLRDVNAPFKLLRRDVWEDLRPTFPDRPSVPSIMLLLGAAVRGRAIVEVPVAHLPRLGGESTLRPVRLARLSLTAAAELVAFRVRLARRDAPARGLSSARRAPRAG